MPQEMPRINITSNTNVAVPVAAQGDSFTSRHCLHCSYRGHMQFDRIRMAAQSIGHIEGAIEQPRNRAQIIHLRCPNCGEISYIQLYLNYDPDTGIMVRGTAIVPDVSR